MFWNTILHLLLHQFRICGRGLRYAMELLESAFNRELLPVAFATVTELQERLGNINDQCVAIDLFRQWKKAGLALTRSCRLKAPIRVASRKLDQAIAELNAWWSPSVRSEFLRSLTQLAETSELWSSPTDQKFATFPTQTQKVVFSIIRTCYDASLRCDLIPAQFMLSFHGNNWKNDRRVEHIARRRWPRYSG